MSLSVRATPLLDMFYLEKQITLKYLLEIGDKTFAN
jgi:hypothetical protein